MCRSRRPVSSYKNPFCGIVNAFFLANYVAGERKPVLKRLFIALYQQNLQLTPFKTKYYAVDRKIPIQTQVILLPSFINFRLNSQLMVKAKLKKLNKFNGVIFHTVSS